MGQQLALFRDSSKSQILVRGISPDDCRISRFNTRKTRDDESVSKLAQRMSANGFELTRALWVYQADDGQYEVFAGGTRLEAARRAGVSVDVVIHEGYSWEDISRLSDQDNENDEYHQPVRPMDVWAEYARLRDEEGWTQSDIAKAKGVSQALVSHRLQYHDGLPEEIRAQIGLLAGGLTERHIEAVFVNYKPANNLAVWADILTWRIEVLQEVIDRPVPSSRLKDRWEKRKAAVERANELIAKLPEDTSDEYLYNSESGITRVDVYWRAVFADLLIGRKARSTGEVNAAFNDLTQRMEASRQRKTDYDANIEETEQAVREEQRRIEEFRAHCHILVGDVLEKIGELASETIDLIITSPPYNLGTEEWPMGGQEFAPRQPRATGIGYTDAMPEDEYQAWQLQVIAALYRVAKPGASFFYNHKVRQRNGEIIHPLDWLRKADNPWTLRQEIIWDRKSTHNHTSVLFWPQDERIYWFTKGKPDLPEQGIKLPSVWSFHGPLADTWHPAPFSEELPVRIMQSVERPGITVLDPFAGSFTTIKVALDRGHHAVGIDISLEYVTQAIEEHQWPIAA